MKTLFLRSVSTLEGVPRSFERLLSPALWVITLCLLGCTSPPPNRWADLTPLLHPSSKEWATVLTQPEAFRAQIVVSEVSNDQTGKPMLKRMGYRVDAEYFYPASSIKLCAAVSALQKLDQMEADHVGQDLTSVPIEIDPLFPGDAPQITDSTHLSDGRISIGHEIRKLCLVSDNQAFNRLFDFVGHEALNRGMHQLGLRSVVLNHRLSETRPIPSPLASAAVRLFPRLGSPILLPARVSTLALSNTSRLVRVGKGFLQGTQLVSAPMDFTRRNGIRLMDLQDLLIKVVRPDIHLGTPPLKLQPNHRSLLVEAMTQYPKESNDPRYPEKDYPDEYGKFLLPGVRRVFPSQKPVERIQITGKIGRAYGFTVENSYLRNPQNQRAVFVTAVLYTNADGILNDDQYEYETLADPFFAQLGEWVARHWLNDP